MALSLRRTMPSRSGGCRKARLGLDILLLGKNGYDRDPGVLRLEFQVADIGQW